MSDDEEEIAEYEGFYSRFTCPSCEDTFDVEGDARGSQVKCDACGWEGRGGGE